MMVRTPLHRGLAHTSFRQSDLRRDPPEVLKIDAVVRVSVRRVKVAMASGCPNQREPHEPRPNRVVLLAADPRPTGRSLPRGETG